MVTFNFSPKTTWNKFLPLLVCLFSCSLLFTSCEDDDDPESNSNFTLSDVTLGGESYRQIVGTIDENVTLSSDINWLLSGGVFVANGSTLTIDAGTTIYAADDGTVPFLSIAQGGKIMANGTASSPIVMTTIKAITGNPSPGDWGGMIVNGYGVLNVGATAEGEGGTGIYGGTDNFDNSGTIRYVRVEYAGKLLSTDNELNGFSFNGVGSGTTIEFIQAFKGADDGIEFFGGAANVKYAVSIGNQDDSFDWTHGWSGKGQFWVVMQQSNGGDRGIEADNNGDDNAASPYSNPTISNITLVGLDDGDASNQGMKLREGTRGIITNAIVTGFPKRGVQVEHDVTLSNMNAGSLSMTNSIVNGPNEFVGTTSAGDDAEVTFASDPTNNTYGAGLNGYIGSISENAMDPTALDSWFSAASYIGAVQSGSNWTQGWTVQ